MAITPSSPRPWLAEVASTILLYAAAAIAVVVTAQSVLADAQDRWASGGSAITFLVGIFTLLAVRAQLRLGVRPLLSYSSLPIGELAEPSGTRTPERTKVTVSNNGLGPAVLESVSYLALRDLPPGHVPPERPPAAAVDYDTLVDQLETARPDRFEQGTDFVMPRISIHGSLGPSTEYSLGEFSPALLSAIGGMAVWITYRGVLGPAYVKCIWVRAPARG
jgi:hypothetical protein